MNFSFAANKKTLAAVVAVLVAVLGLVKVLGGDDAPPAPEAAATDTGVSAPAAEGDATAVTPAATETAAPAATEAAAPAAPAAPAAQ